MEFIDRSIFKNLIGIYKITNRQNGMVYIGQTKENFYRRYLLHRWQLRNDRHSNNALQDDWNKYHGCAFCFEVIETISSDLLDEREKFWIKFFRAFDLCYNIQDGGIPHNLNRYVSPESHKRVGEKNRQRMLGSKLPESTKQKMSEAHRGKHVRKSNDVLTPEIAKRVKEMFLEGFSSGQIMEELKIPYKPINGILSGNTWRMAHVDGWDEFFQSRKRHKGAVVNSNKKVKHPNDYIQKSV